MNPAYTWGIVVSICVAIGFAFGFAACYFWMRDELRKANGLALAAQLNNDYPTDPALFYQRDPLDHPDATLKSYATPPRAETPVQRETHNVPIAREVVKEVVPSGSAFGQLKYEDVGEMFLDNFLLKYFHSLMDQPFAAWNSVPVATPEHDINSPWKRFCLVNPWAKGMPEVFWLMTGYRPDDYQLSQAISEYSRRVSKV